jgi:hypothetical protein
MTAAVAGRGVNFMGHLIRKMGKRGNHIASAMQAARA